MNGVENKKLPFHEAIINKIRHYDPSDTGTILDLIESVEITEGHDEIIAAILERWGENWFWKERVEKVAANILEQKETVKSAARTTDRKAAALMIVIQKMIARYQNQHAGNTDEGMFRLFEKAKVIKWAENDAQLQAAIAGL